MRESLTTRRSTVRIATVAIGDVVWSYGRKYRWRIIGRNEFGDVMVRRLEDGKEHAVASSEQVHGHAEQVELFA